MNEPEVCRLPVKLCVSAVSSPNFVEPLLNNIDALTNSVFISCAVSVPNIVALPSTVIFPVFVREPVRDKSVDVIEASFIVVSPMETELAETLLKITSLVVATACPILNVVAMVLLPSNRHCSVIT